jgi:hypothetical protein
LGLDADLAAMCDDTAASSLFDRETHFAAIGAAENECVKKFIRKLINHFL